MTLRAVSAQAASADVAALAGSLGKPYFQASISVTQTPVVSTNTKIQFDTEVEDSSACYDPATYRFTPNKPGLYYVNVSYLGSSTVTTLGAWFCNAYVYKNGVAYKASQFVQSSLAVAVAATGNPTVSCVVRMNGTTDYLEGFGVIGQGTTPTFAANSFANFSAFYIGP